MFLSYVVRLLALLLIFTQILINCENENKRISSKIPASSLEQAPIKKKHRVTIWIHGTRGAAFLPLNITKTIKRIERKACEAPHGIHKASDISNFYYQKFIAQTISQADNEEFPFEHFYIFGWSGALRHSARVFAGKQLYYEIRALNKKYIKIYGEKPHITFISHSHGGNVAMASGLYGKRQDSSFIIDRFICLACPVQRVTEHSLDNTIFSKVYSLYSSKDYLQVLDPQKLPLIWNLLKAALFLAPIHQLKNQLHAIRHTPLFSARLFKSSNKIIQTAIYWKDIPPLTDKDIFLYEAYGEWVRKTFQILHTKAGRELLHIEFIHHSFLIKLPEILKRIESNSYLFKVDI